LEEHLRGLGVTTLVFAGCNFPNCPRTSIYEASERDFRLIIVEDATSGFDECARLELENVGVFVHKDGRIPTGHGLIRVRGKLERLADRDAAGVAPDVADDLLRPLEGSLADEPRP
jgi:hypothetical protein